MASSRTSAVGNKFVTVHCSLSTEEQRDINSLTLKIGKIGGLVRSRGKLGV